MLYIVSVIIIIALVIYLIVLKRQNNKLNKLLSVFSNDINILRDQLQTSEIETEKRYKQLFESWKITEEASIRKDSLERSRSILRGQATEHLIPLTINSISPKDFRFMGNPIDYIIFNGLSAVADKTAEDLESVIFLDIKTGKSRLTKVQRRIKKCIESGRVQFVVYNPDKDEPEKLTSILA